MNTPQALKILQDYSAWLRDASNQSEAPHQAELADAIDTIITSLTWQPIETAPKDGKIIFLNFDNYTSEGRYGKYTINNVEKKGWYYYDYQDSFYSTDFNDEEPTHWMHLPPTYAAQCLIQGSKVQLKNDKQE